MSLMAVTMIDECTKRDESVTAIPAYREKDDKEAVIREHQIIAAMSVEKTEVHCREQLNINRRPAKYHLTFGTMLSRYAYMWNGHLERCSSPSGV